MSRAVDIEGRGVRVNRRSVGVGSAIPDSATLRYKMDAGSGSDVFDAIGSNDAVFNGGLNWVADPNFVGGYKIESTGGFIDPSSNNVNIRTNDDFSVGITLDAENTASGREVIWAHWNGNVGKGFTVYRDEGDGIATVRFDGGYLDYKTHSEPSAPYTVRLLLTWDSSASSNELYLNKNTSTGTSGSETPLSTINGTAICTNDGGNRSLASNNYVDDFIIYDAIVDETDDYDRQPWS